MGLLILLTGLGCLGNYLGVTLFFGADFIFGSIAGLIIISLYGLRYGLPANLIICSQTYFLWGHPYCILIFFLEALFVGLFLRYRKMNLLLIDGLFWLIAGAPIGVFLHTTLIASSTAVDLLLILKQAVNGVFNALFAALAVNHLPFQKILGSPDNSKSISLHESTVNLLTALVLIPTFLIVIQNGRKEMATIENETIGNLQGLSKDITNHLRPWYENRLHLLSELAQRAGRTEMIPSGNLQRDTELVMRGFSDFRSLYIANAQGTTITYEPPVNEKGESVIGMNFSDRPYFQMTRQNKTPVLSEVFVGRGGAPAPIITLSIPVIREGEFSGVVAGALDLTKIREILDPYSKDRGVNITLLDSAGRIVATTEPNRETMEIYRSKKRLGFGRNLHIDIPYVPSGEDVLDESLEAVILCGGKAGKRRYPLDRGNPISRGSFAGKITRNLFPRLFDVGCTGNGSPRVRAYFLQMGRPPDRRIGGSHHGSSFETSRAAKDRMAKKLRLRNPIFDL